MASVSSPWSTRSASRRNKAPTGESGAALKGPEEAVEVVWNDADGWSAETAGSGASTASSSRSRRVKRESGAGSMSQVEAKSSIRRRPRSPFVARYGDDPAPVPRTSEEAAKPPSAEGGTRETDPGIPNGKGNAGVSVSPSEEAASAGVRDVAGGDTLAIGVCARRAPWCSEEGKGCRSSSSPSPASSSSSARGRRRALRRRSISAGASRSELKSAADRAVDETSAGVSSPASVVLPRRWKRVPIPAAGSGPTPESGASRALAASVSRLRRCRRPRGRDTTASSSGDSSEADANADVDDRCWLSAKSFGWRNPFESRSLASSRRVLRPRFGSSD